MTKLFFSYSHKDEALRNELETHLALLKRQGIISSWHDRRISAGEDFGQAISSELESAQLVLLLVSANFLASDYCFEREMRKALEKHAEGTAVVVPVILHPCDWQASPLGSLRATPTDGLAISMHANQHEALACVAKDVREAANRFLGRQSPVEATNSDDKPALAIVAEARSSNLRVKRKFDDHEQDEFLENSYEYIARYFDGSLDELSRRNPSLKARFKRLDATSFTASIYEAGKRVAQCSVWYGGGFTSRGIAYSQSSDVSRNSFNESLSIVDDGYTLQLKPMGIPFYGGERDKALSQQGAAEYYWEMLVKPLQ